MPLSRRAVQSAGAALLLAASSLDAQVQALRVTIPETGAAARVRVVGALLEVGVPVTQVAACESLVTGGPVDVKPGLTSLVTWGRFDVSLLPAPTGTTVVLTAMITSLPMHAQPVFAVRTDTTGRMPGEERAAARLLHQIAARLSVAP